MGVPSPSLGGSRALAAEKRPEANLSNYSRRTWGEQKPQGGNRRFRGAARRRRPNCGHSFRRRRNRHSLTPFQPDSSESVQGGIERRPGPLGFASPSWMCPRRSGAPLLRAKPRAACPVFCLASAFPTTPARSARRTEVPVLRGTHSFGRGVGCGNRRRRVKHEYWPSVHDLKAVGCGLGRHRTGGGSERPGCSKRAHQETEWTRPDRAWPM